MVTKSPGIEYEINIGKEKMKGICGGSTLRIQIHLGKQRIAKCMGESVNKGNGESVCRSSSKRSRSGEDVETSGEDSYTPPSRSYRSSEDVDTGGGED